MAKSKADRLEEARQFQYFKRDADELELWILEKLQTAQEESYKDPTNLQVSLFLFLFIIVENLVFSSLSSK